MLDTGVTSALPEDTPVFTPGGTGRHGDLPRLLLDPQTRVGIYLHHSPALLPPRAFEAHPGCRAGTLIRLDVAGTRTTVPGPPMGARYSVGTDVVASTPNGFLLGNPTWRLVLGDLGTGATNPLLLRFRFGRSNRYVKRRNLVIERHSSLPVVGRSMALASNPIVPLAARHVEKPVSPIVPPKAFVA